MWIPAGAIAVQQLIQAAEQDIRVITNPRVFEKHECVEQEAEQVEEELWSFHGIFQQMPEMMQ